MVSRWKHVASVERVATAQAVERTASQPALLAHAALVRAEKAGAQTIGTIRSQGPARRARDALLTHAVFVAAAGRARLLVAERGVERRITTILIGTLCSGCRAIGTQFAVRSALGIRRTGMALILLVAAARGAVTNTPVLRGRTAAFRAVAIEPRERAVLAQRGPAAALRVGDTRVAESLVIAAAAALLRRAVHSDALLSAAEHARRATLARSAGRSACRSHCPTCANTLRIAATRNARLRTAVLRGSRARPPRPGLLRNARRAGQRAIGALPALPATRRRNGPGDALIVRAAAGTRSRAARGHALLAHARLTARRARLARKSPGATCHLVVSGETHVLHAAPQAVALAALRDSRIGRGQRGIPARTRSRVRACVDRGRRTSVRGGTGHAGRGTAAAARHEKDKTEDARLGERVAEVRHGPQYFAPTALSHAPKFP